MIHPALPSDGAFGQLDIGIGDAATAECAESDDAGDEDVAAGDVLANIATAALAHRLLKFVGLTLRH